MPTVLLVRHGRSTRQRDRGCWPAGRPASASTTRAWPRPRPLGDRLAVPAAGRRAWSSSPAPALPGDRGDPRWRSAADRRARGADDARGVRATARGPAHAGELAKEPSGGPSRTSRARRGSRTATSSPGSRWREMQARAVDASPRRPTPRSRRPRRRRGVGGGVARRRHQGDPRRRGRRAPGPVPADPRSTRRRCRWSATPRAGRSCCASTTPAATWAGSSRRHPSPTAGDAGGARPDRGGPGRRRGRWRRGLGYVACRVIDFDPPDRFVAGTVGPPGQRTFFLQAASGRRLVSVSLREAAGPDPGRPGQRPAGPASPARPRRPAAEVEDNDPLDDADRGRVPRGNALRWRGTPSRRSGRHRVPRRGHPEPGEDEAEATDVPEEFLESMASRQSVRVVLSPPQARAFARRARALVSAGRPPCPFCGGPLDPTGHICPRANGYKR